MGCPLVAHVHGLCTALRLDCRSDHSEFGALGAIQDPHGTLLHQFGLHNRLLGRIEARSGQKGNTGSISVSSASWNRPCGG